MTIGSLFDERPVPWGLRGDPHLWQEMQYRFESTPLPASLAAFDRLLVEAYESVTGQSVENDTFVYVERFDHGGMSRGMVSPPWWRETAFPLLRSRYREAVSSGRKGSR
ncbi:MAG: hypothetical protein AAF791_01615 [Bacteroidota bacterium]